MKPNLAAFVVILHQPRDVRNIGAVVRAMLNTGLRRLRLVAPAPFDPTDLGGIAHRSEELVAAIEIFDDLARALADLHVVVGTSARAHPQRPVRSDLRILAEELHASSANGSVGLLFGPEDNGLDNEALARCHHLLSLPCDPAYPSLNLAQAVLLILYEIRQAASAPPSAPVPALASSAEIDQALSGLEALIEASDFFRGQANPTRLHRLRSLLHKASPDEAALLGALAHRAAKRLRK